MTPTIIDSNSLQAAGKLRHQFFVQEKAWVADGGSMLELDHYDPHALHFGVELNGELVAYMRGLRGDAPTGYMLDHDFYACLTPELHMCLERRNGMELSRRVVSNSLSRAEGLQAVELLFKTFSQYALGDDIKSVYLVQEPAYTPMLQRIFGLNFTTLNPEPYTFPDGTCGVVVSASSDDLIAGLKSRGKWSSYENFISTSKLQFNYSPRIASE